MSSFTSTTNNKCRKFCCVPVRDPDTISLGIRLHNLKQVGLTGPARSLRHRAPMRGLPGIDLDRTDVYVNVSNGAKREWRDDEDGWQTIVGKVRKPKAEPWSSSQPVEHYAEPYEAEHWDVPQGKWVA